MARPTAYKAFIPVELRDRPLKDGLVVQALEIVGRGRGRPGHGRALHRRRRGRRSWRSRPPSPWVAGRVCSGPRPPLAATTSSADRRRRMAMSRTKPRRSRSEHAAHAKLIGADLLEEAHRAADCAESTVMRVASLVGGQDRRSRGRWPARRGARPAGRHDLGRPDRRDGGRGRRDHQGRRPPPAHRRGHPRGQPAGQDRGHRRAHPHRHLRASSTPITPSGPRSTSSSARGSC